MMLVASVEHFETSAGYATGSFCEIQNNVQVREVDVYAYVKPLSGVG